MGKTSTHYLGGLYAIPLVLRSREGCGQRGAVTTEGSERCTVAGSEDGGGSQTSRNGGGL